MDRKEMSNGRLYLLAAFLAAVLCAYLFVLFDVQIVHHEEYADQAMRSIPRMEKVEASRGIITGRTENLLAPQEAVTRAECAMMLLRCAEILG